jgi:hypothetical protein
MFVSVARLPDDLRLVASHPAKFAGFCFRELLFINAGKPLLALTAAF